MITTILIGLFDGKVWYYLSVVITFILAMVTVISFFRLFFLFLEYCVYKKLTTGAMNIIALLGVFIVSLIAFNYCTMYVDLSRFLKRDVSYMLIRHDSHDKDTVVSVPDTAFCSRSTRTQKIDVLE